MNSLSEADLLITCYSATLLDNSSRWKSSTVTVRASTPGVVLLFATRSFVDDMAATAFASEETTNSAANNQWMHGADLSRLGSRNNVVVR